jgi:hypothetical protein
MLRLLLLPFLLVAIAVGAVATYAWSHFLRDQIHPEWDPNLAYSGHVEMQRHLAKCYEVGCPETPSSPVLACAWRDIIVQETNRASLKDIAEAERVCGLLSTKDKTTLEQVEADIRVRIRRTMPKT